MLEITEINVDGQVSPVGISSPTPVFAWKLESNQANTIQTGYRITVWDENMLIWNSGSVVSSECANISCGVEVPPYRKMRCHVVVTDNHHQTAEAEMSFYSGKLNEAWSGSWISDADFHFTEEKTSPKPMVFRKRIHCNRKIRDAKIYATAIGIYQIYLNNKEIGSRYFAPGFTSYGNNLQFQTYDVTDSLSEKNELRVIVAGGWAVGSYTMSRKNRFYADRQALLLELHIIYENDTKEIISSDTSWEVCEESNFLSADLYDGEVFDANIDIDKSTYHTASVEQLRICPKIMPEYGLPVTIHEIFCPVAVTKSPSGKLLYDFGQNFAGVVSLHIKTAKQGQVITVRHGEIISSGGELNTHFLRTAKATITYICKNGEQKYTPTFTYMGFRYISVEGIQENDIDIQGMAVYSDMRQIGNFECSDERLNRLQQNILWSSKSNFVDIPTDCPQRDERMGWTGDIALFAPTACFNFEISRFLKKWLKDVKAEQLKSGGIPNTVPAHHYRFPYTLVHLATDFWGDVVLLAPWALYQATGDKNILEDMYLPMKKYVDACRFWARLIGFGKKRYIWDTAYYLHYGDWVSPDSQNMKEWQKRSKWTATASLFHTSSLLAEIAGILGYEKDQLFYSSYADKVAKSYSDILLNGTGKLTKEFQTGYVLPLQFQMLNGVVKKNALDHLVRLVKENDYCIGTGFPGTPYILFALADNGYVDVAYRMLMNTKCPSWLHEVVAGGTTIWERWDGLNANGVCEFENAADGGMVSFNHYASGAVGNFMYRRIAGIEPISPGYKEFMVKPLPGSGLTYAKCSTVCPYGEIKVHWVKEDSIFRLSVDVPIGTICKIVLPDGVAYEAASGHHEYQMKIGGKEHE